MSFQFLSQGPIIVFITMLTQGHAHGPATENCSMNLKQSRALQ